MKKKKQIQLTKNDLIINRRLSKLFSLINKYEELSKKGTWLYKLLLGVLLIATAIIIYVLFTTDVIASVISNINNQKNVSIVEIALAFFLPLLNIIATGLFYFETNYCTSKIDTNNKIIDLSNTVYELGYNLYLNGKLTKENKELFENKLLDIEENKLLNIED